MIATSNDTSFNELFIFVDLISTLSFRSRARFIQRKTCIFYAPSGDYMDLTPPKPFSWRIHSSLTPRVPLGWGVVSRGRWRVGVLPSRPPAEEIEHDDLAVERPPCALPPTVPTSVHRDTTLRLVETKQAQSFVVSKNTSIWSQPVKNYAQFTYPLLRGQSKVFLSKRTLLVPSHCTTICIVYIRQYNELSSCT